MPEQTESRVAVYIDFDNIVISRYNQLNGQGAWHRDNARSVVPSSSGDEVAKRLQAATVDVGAVLDYASSYGTVALSRAYADWSVPAHASYRRQLVDRAIDLTQLFPTTAGMKNGADIRLAVDVVDDLFRLPDLSHVVIVAGDSDYIALAQRCKRLGRFVVGIGVAGGTSPALIAACDEFELYDAIPGETATGADEAQAPSADADAAAEDTTDAKLSDTAATRLLVRALELGHAKDDADWLNASTVKSQIKRMNPSFNEKLLGFKSFTDFVRSRGNLAEVKVEGQQRSIRLRETPKEPARGAKEPARRSTKKKSGVKEDEK